MTQARRSEIIPIHYGKPEGYGYRRWDPLSDKLPYEQHTSTFKSDDKARAARKISTKGRAKNL